MNALFITLALTGAVLFIIGRLMLINQARQFGIGWLFALRLVPLAEFVFLMRYWEYAKTGTLTSVIGLLLILPLGTKQFIESKQNGMDYFISHNDEDLGQESSHQKAYLDARKKQRMTELMQKDTKVQELNAKLSYWYQSLQQKRIGLEKKTQQEILAYNREAAAYQSFLAVTKEETNELNAMRTTSLKK